MHIAIIGAGVSGLLSALELVEQGCSVSIFDQQHANQSASWAGGGILSPMYPWRYPTAVNQLAQFGKEAYQAWNQQLVETTGIDFQIHHTGMLIFDEDDFKQGLAYKDRYQEPMQQCHSVANTRLQQLNPRVSSQFKQAIYFPELSNIRNPRLLKSLFCYLAQHPRVQFHHQQSIHDFVIKADRVHAIRSTTGQTFQADQFVITTGAWSGHWSEQLQLEIPVTPVQGQMLLFKTPKNWLPTMCMHRVMYLIPRQDGHVVCGSSVQHRGFDTTPQVEVRASILKASIEMVPELAQFPIVQQWAGLRPGSPDGIPYIGKMPELDNLWANFGHYRNGLCMGPASAQLLRQLMLAQKTVIDPTAYSTSRLQSNAFAMTPL